VPHFLTTAEVHELSLQEQTPGGSGQVKAFSMAQHLKAQFDIRDR
jgi:hypothetical protein